MSPVLRGHRSGIVTKHEVLLDRDGCSRASTVTARYCRPWNVAPRADMLCPVNPLRISLLGAPRIEVDGRPLAVDTRKATAMLAYLAVTGHTHTRAVIAN